MDEEQCRTKCGVLGSTAMQKLQDPREEERRDMARKWGEILGDVSRKPK